MSDTEKPIEKPEPEFLSEEWFIMQENRTLDRIRAGRGPKPKRETQIQKEIADTLVDEGFMVIRINSAQMWRDEYKRADGSTAEAAPMWAYRVVNGNMTAGHSDLIVSRGGLCWYVEVKRDDGRQSATQKKFQDLCERHGMPYLIMRDKAEARAWARSIKESWRQSS